MQFQVKLDAMEGFAEKFWQQVDEAAVFAFHGQMGAGKTTIITALCRKKGVTDTMGSPTFSIINEYAYAENGQQKKIYHVDLYRLKDEEEVVQSGVEDVVYSGAVCMIEWPEKAPHLFDEQTVHVTIEVVSETERSVKLKLPAF